MAIPKTTTTEIEFLAAFKELFNPKWRTIVLHGGRNSGKTRQVAEALLIRARNQRLRILCTRELQNTIKDSVHKLLADLIAEHGWNEYEVLVDTIRNRLTGSEFIFKGVRHNTTEIKGLEGIDICWCEEAQSMTEASLRIIAPTVRKPGSQLIFTFNRVTELDPVYVRYVLKERPNTFVKQVNYDVLERAGLLSDEIRMELEADMDNPATFAHVWLGQPLAQSDAAIIGRDKILEAMQRTVSDEGAVIVGVDVARLGNDRTVFYKRKGHQSKSKKVLQHKRTTEVCDELEVFVEFDKTVELRIDDTGVGGGVTDEMMRRGYNVVAVNFGGKANDPDKYPNWISEAWFNLAIIIDQIGLLFDDDLLMELSTRNWKQNSKGQRAVEGKGDYKKRGYRSPDYADACIICYAAPVPRDGIIRMNL